MNTTAAVLVELGKPLVVAEIEVPALKTGQVLVEIAFSGVCHTQILECRGFRGPDAFIPHCLGHEGSGIVSGVGPGVSKFKVGDSVILSWMKGSGANGNATLYRWKGKNVNAGAITTFSRHAVISENRLTTLPAKVSLASAALLGCAVPTGMGAVLNAANPKPGQSLIIFGAGGVGLCAIAAAALAKCSPIMAVDTREDRLEAARKMGAAHIFLAPNEDVAASIKRLCPEGVDFAIEASGRPEVMRQALESVRERGGTAVVVGNARHGERLEIDPRQLNLGKRLVGTWGGDNAPDADFPKYGRWLAEGRFTLNPILSKPYPLSAINEALEDLEKGRVIRPLISMAEH